MIKFKHARAVNYKANADTGSDRIRTGIASVFGNIDDGGDITHQGAFAKTLSEGRQRTKHLWNHNSSLPPIARIIEIKEIGKADLPSEILSYAPEATGGLLVKREYLDTPLADEVLKCIDAGVVNEMSFAYDIIKADDSTIDGKTVRNLRELALYDTSDVNYGMNPATVASGAKGLFASTMPLGAIIQQLQLLNEDFLKSGRRNSSADMVLINHLHDIAKSLGCDNCATDNTNQQETDDTEKQAEAVLTNTSLVDLKQMLRRLKIEKLKL